MPKSNIKKIKKLVGLVLKDAKDKTVSVKVTSVKVHPLYKKRYFRTKKYLVHTETDVKQGQTVVISETKPFSRKKSWQFVQVVVPKDKK